jgi:hypothetical protein
MDMDAVVDGQREDPYPTFNLLLRRSAKENNFKAVLQTIRDLMMSECVVPQWLHDVFLGYGNPSTVKYYKLPSQVPALKFSDTFVDTEHVLSSFPGTIAPWQASVTCPCARSRCCPSSAHRVLSEVQRGRAQQTAAAVPLHVPRGRGARLRSAAASRGPRRPGGRCCSGCCCCCCRCAGGGGARQARPRA